MKVKFSHALREFPNIHSNASLLEGTYKHESRTGCEGTILLEETTEIMKQRTVQIDLKKDNIDVKFQYTENYFDCNSYLIYIWYAGDLLS